MHRATSSASVQPTHRCWAPPCPFVVLCHAAPKIPATMHARACDAEAGYTHARRGSRPVTAWGCGESKRPQPCPRAGARVRRRRRSQARPRSGMSQHVRSAKRSPHTATRAGVPQRRTRMTVSRLALAQAAAGAPAPSLEHSSSWADATTTAPRARTAPLGAVRAGGAHGSGSSSRAAPSTRTTRTTRRPVAPTGARPQARKSPKARQRLAATNRTGTPTARSGAGRGGGRGSTGTLPTQARGSGASPAQGWRGAGGIRGQAPDSSDTDDGMTCASCGKGGAGEYTEFGGKWFHVGHLKCAARCGTVLGPGVKVYGVKKKPYCRACHIRLFAKTCAGCKQKIACVVGASAPALASAPPSLTHALHYAPVCACLSITLQVWCVREGTNWADAPCLLQVQRVQHAHRRRCGVQHARAAGLLPAALLGVR